MKNLLYNIISKWPIKVLMIVVILIVSIAFFVSKVNLSTGNETLIDPSTKTYMDNFNYQETFGTDPILIVFQGDNEADLLSFESFIIMNDIKESLDDLDGIFYINSPIGLIDYAMETSYTNYETGLYEISNGLLTMSTTITNMSLINSSIDSEVMLSTFETLATAQEDLSTTFTNQITIFTNMKTTVGDEITRLETEAASLDPVVDEDRILCITQTLQILTNVFNLYDQLITMNTSFASGATQTKTALESISLELNTLFVTMSSVQSNMDSLATTLNTLGQTLKTLADNFNMFTPNFPTSSSTLDRMVYPEGNRNPMFDMYLIDETHMYMSIILKESASNDDIERILHTIDMTIENTIYEDALVSGKPVLDFDIQHSMMDSMQTMMISAGIIMVIILFVLFPVPLRLLPLFIVLLAVITTIGIMGLFSIPLTMVSMAVFPVLIGLGIDYSIQFHNRYTEEDLGGNQNEQ